MFKKRFEKLCSDRGLAPSMVCMNIGLSNSAYSMWDENSVPRKTTLIKIAEFFDVSVDYLLGREEDVQKEISPTADGNEAVKVALFGGDTEVTDEMWNEVMNYAEFLKQKYKKD